MNFHLRMQRLWKELPKHLDWSSVSLYYKLIIVLLLVCTIAHMRIPIHKYLMGETWIVRDVEFFNEKKSLQFPKFVFCFSKLFTYNLLNKLDVEMLYNRSDGGALAGDLQKYSWKPSLDDIFTRVIVGRKAYEPEDIFQMIWISPSQSCWQININNFAASHPGRVSVAEFTVNIAVYDDLIVNYNSGLTYLTIIPFYGNNQKAAKVPDMANSISISPGRLSSVGFDVTKTDFTHRSKRDLATCHIGNESSFQCRSSHLSDMIASICRFNPFDNTSVVSTEYSCALHAFVDPSKCLSEPCVKKKFRFTKSEAFLKFDESLSAFNMGPQHIQREVKRMTYAANVHSQFNPYTRNSFLQLADGMDNVTLQIANSLSMSKGFSCDKIKKDSFNLLPGKSKKIPIVLAESEYMRVLRDSYTSSSIYTFEHKLQKTLLQLFHRPPVFSGFTPLVLPFNFINCKSTVWVDAIEGHSKQAESLEHLDSNISDVGSFINRILQLLERLHEYTSLMLANYRNLKFTRFIETYSDIEPLRDYSLLLNNVIIDTISVQREIFMGSQNRQRPFAHDDDQIKTIFNSRPYNFTMNWPASYKNNIWMQFAWINLKEIKGLGYKQYHHDVRNHALQFEAIVGRKTGINEIPLIVDIICGFYSSYLAKAERFHATDTSYSLLSTDARFKYPKEYVIFVLSRLFESYDTSTLFSLDNEGIIGAERRSCLRMIGYPSYITPNVSYEAALHKFNILKSNLHGRHGGERSYHIYRKIVPDRILVVMRLIRNYQTTFQMFTKSSKKFNGYYKAEIIDRVTSVTTNIKRVRSMFTVFKSLKLIKQDYKFKLVNQLRTVADLIRQTAAGSGEGNISEYLSRKGKILVGQIQLELMEIKSELAAEYKSFMFYRDIIGRQMETMADNRTMNYAITRAVMTTTMHNDPPTQDRILSLLNACNIERWYKARRQLLRMIKEIHRWLVGMPFLVRRSKAYTKSIEISKAFVRQNMMRISLYYSSLAVFSEVNEPKITLDSMMSQIGAIADIYLGVTMSGILSFITVLITWSIYRWQSTPTKTIK